MKTFSGVVLAEDAGSIKVVGQQEEGSQKLLHSHHGLHEMLHVHVCHLGRFGASDGIMMLHLRTQFNRKISLWQQYTTFGLL